MKLKYILLVIAVLLVGAMFLVLPKIRQKIAKQSQTAQQTAATAETNPVIPRLVAIDVPILMYHHIKDNIDANDPYDKDLSVKADDFRAQMQYLKENDYQTIHLADLLGFWYEGKNLPQNPVVLTFDDAYDNFLTNAWPILKENGQTATIAPIIDFIDTEGYLTGEEIKMLSDQGVEIASHTVEHRELDKLDKETQIKELKESKEFLESLILRPISAVVYPVGKYNETTIGAVKETGYQLGITTKSGWQQDPEKPFEIKRLRIHGSSAIEQFGALLETTK